MSIAIHRTYLLFLLIQLVGSASIAIHRTYLLFPLIQLVVHESFIAFRSMENFTSSSHVRSALRARKESMWGCRWLMFQHGITDWILITFYKGVHPTAEPAHRICKFDHIVLYINKLYGAFSLGHGTARHRADDAVAA